MVFYIDGGRGYIRLLMAAHESSLRFKIGYHPSHIIAGTPISELSTRPSPSNFHKFLNLSSVAMYEKTAVVEHARPNPQVPTGPIEPLYSDFNLFFG